MPSDGSVTGRRARRPAAETRDLILDAAYELFYWSGIRASGVDTVADAAEVGPTTLYRHFASKDDLVAAYMERTADEYRKAVGDATAPAVGAPRDRILALLDAVQEMVQPDRCRGCPFLMALAEFPDRTHPAHVVAEDTKRWVRAHVHELTRALADSTPVTEPEVLADQLVLVLEGVYASVQALTVAGPAAHARSAAEALIDAATRRAAGA